MNLDELLELDEPPTVLELPPEELHRFFWKYRGLLKNQERDEAFWNATNSNLQRAYEKLDEKDRQLTQAYSIIQDDLAVAQQVQNALLPTPPDEFSRILDIAVHHEQLSEVGGDYYDYFRSTDDSERTDLAIGVFDISGHGVSAALVMAYLKAMFMQGMDQHGAPREVVEWVNRVSIGFLKQVKKYSTVNFVQILGDSLRYVCGGGFGLLIHDGSPLMFERRDHFLGLRDRPFRQYVVPFDEGDLLALYTDGLVEAQNGEGEDYSTSRLNRLIAAHSAEPVGEILQRCMDDYRAFRTQDIDDITLLILRRKAS